MALERVVGDILESKKYYTFDDVLLRPQYSEVTPTHVKTNTYLTKKIKLNIPILSAAMDTVTEEKMAIHMASQGGIGIIHKLLTPQEQADKVKAVKKFQSGIILEPTCVDPNESISYIQSLSDKFGYSSFPVTDTGDNNGRVLGIITKTDYDIVKHENKKVSDRMTPRKNLKTANYNISLEKANNILLDEKLSKLILTDGKNKLRGLITRKDIDKRRKHPYASKDRKDRLRVGAAIGIKKSTKDTTLEYRVDKLLDSNVDVLVIDTAHGHSKNVGYTLEFIKKKYGDDIQVIAGNVATEEGTEYLINKGADAVKVGVGPGSICTTREVAGVGMPQFSATLICSNQAYKMNPKNSIPIIADGGIRNSGDIAKSIAVGASSVMLGSLLAGTPEAPGKVIKINGVTYKEYSGMGSRSKMMKGSKDRYGQQEITERDKLVPEGIEGKVPLKESTEEILVNLVGGLTSSMGYQGCKNVNEFKKIWRNKSKVFVPCSSSTIIENKTSVDELDRAIEDSE